MAVPDVGAASGMTPRLTTNTRPFPYHVSADIAVVSADSAVVSADSAVVSADSAGGSADTAGESADSAAANVPGVALSAPPQAGSFRSASERYERRQAGSRKLSQEAG